jgi:hypothetical protein
MGPYPHRRHMHLFSRSACPNLIAERMFLEFIPPDLASCADLASDSTSVACFNPTATRQRQRAPSISSSYAVEYRPGRDGKTQSGQQPIARPALTRLHRELVKAVLQRLQAATTSSGLAGQPSRARKIKGSCNFRLAPYYTSHACGFSSALRQGQVPQAKIRKTRNYLTGM